MSQFVAVSVFNKQFNSYAAPDFFANFAAAKEFYHNMFLSTYYNKQSAVKSLLKDYALYSVGLWDTEKAEFIPAAPFVFVCDTSDLFGEEKPLNVRSKVA